MTAKLTTDVNRPAIPADGATISAEFDVEPGRQEESVSRHVVLTIDTSASMHGEKIDRARDGASWVFGLLEPEDYVAIVAFDSEAELLMRPTPWADISREAAMDHVTDLTAGGGTDMYDGLTTARDAIDSISYQTDAENPVRRILLLSDGKDNHRDPADFELLAEDIDESGIRIKAAGIGSDYEEETIRRLGTRSRGEWTHLDDAGEIESFFGGAVESASTVVAPDAQLSLDAAPGVEVSDVYRAMPQAQEVTLDWEGNAAVVKLPDLAERESQRVVCKVHAPPTEIDEERVETLLDVTLEARGATAETALEVLYTDDQSKLATHNEDVQLDHRQTVIKTELGKGNVEAAETQIEKMTKVHGEERDAVQAAERETQLVKEGGLAEQNQATKIVTEDRVEQ